MRKEILRWRGREFVFLSFEAAGGRTATDQMENIFKRMAAELQHMELSLANTIRTRLWAADRESRDQGSLVRKNHNTGPNRAATSSYIAPEHFESDSRVGLDLIALRPSQPSLEKKIVETNPPRVPIDYLIYDGLVVLAGKTVVLPTLSEQLDEILPRITRILASAGTGWERVLQVSCYLHASQSAAELTAHFDKWVKVPLERMEIGFAQGYSAEGKLIEVEVTAELK